MAKRKQMSKRARFEVFKRDKFTCQYCGRTPPQVILETDHIVAVANGGRDEEGNLVTSCFDCNRGKSSVPLDSAPTAIKEQMQEKRDRVAQFEAYNAFLLEVRERETDLIEELGTYWYNQVSPPEDRDKFTFGKDRQRSLRLFLKSLPAAEIYDSIDLAMSRRPPSARGYDDQTFKYFCGICWSKIRQLEGSHE